MTSFVVSPNPIAENAAIRWNAATAGQYNIRLYNAQGQLVSAEKFNGQSGTNVWNLNGNALSSGVYQFVIQSPNGSVTSKQIVK